MIQPAGNAREKAPEIRGLLRTPAKVAALSVRERESIIAEAKRQGVLPLLFPWFSEHIADEDFRNRLAKYLRHAEALELLRLSMLTDLLREFEKAGIHTLLMKGAALAYSLYGSPGQRTRMDTDILIRARDLPAARALLVGMGFHLTGDDNISTLNYQFIATRRLNGGHTEAIDVHYRLSNRAAFARLFDFDELLARAARIPDLGESALALGHADALLLACLHRIGHLNENEPERLIWLYDIHLLVERLDEPELRRFAELAAAKGLVAICRDGIRKSAECFGTDTAGAFAMLPDKPLDRESAADMLKAGPIRALWIQIRAQPDFRSRLQLIGELVFPPPAYMKKKYPDSRQWLTVLYVRRAVEGIRRRMK